MTTRKTFPVTPAAAGYALQYATNKVNNPRAGVNATNWGANFGTGGTATQARVATGGPLPDAPTFYQVSWSVGPTSGAPNVRNGAAGQNLVPASTLIEASLYVRASWAAIVQVQLGLYEDTTFRSAPTGTAVTLTPNVWTRITYQTTTAANVNRAQPTVVLAAGSPLPPSSSNLGVTGLMVYKRESWMVGERPYTDGESEGWDWDGAAHASSSRGYAAVA